MANDKTKSEEKRQNTPRIKHFTVDSLQEYFEIIHLINEYEQVKKIDGEGGGLKSDIFSLWYRGHEYSHYQLLPNIFREVKKSDDIRTDKPYSDLHLQEDYRYHHFKSKVNQLINTFPETKIEWQELMQHHLTRTRLMDWSESAVSSLMFALEAFINPKTDKELEHKRATMTPAIWVLNPRALNYKIYDQFCAGTPYAKDLIQAVIHDVCPHKISNKDSQKLVDGISQALRDRKDDFLTGKTAGKEYKINGIVCLSAIVMEQNANQDRLFQMLTNFEVNPFFYLLSRYYADGMKVRAGVLPPLATVHPYHSARIQAQHGVFTVVPYYYFDDHEAALFDIGIDKRAMEQQALTADCLYEIRITNPARVARDLLLAGERRSSIYPELEVYAGDIEAKKYYI